MLAKTMMTTKSLFGARMLLAFSSLFLLNCGERPAPARPPPGLTDAHASYSLQVTGVSPSLPFLVNSTKAARWIAPTLRETFVLQNHVLKGKAADYHFHLEVFDVKRLTGMLAASCDVELYLYSEWPGDLIQENQLRQAKGLKKKNGARGQVLYRQHFSSRVRARSKNEGGSILRKAAQACGAEVAEVMQLIARGR